MPMIFPLIILGLGAIFYGYLTRDLIIGLGSPYFNLIHTNFYNFNLIDSEFLPSFIKNVPFIFTVIGAFFSLLLINCFNVNKEYVMAQKLRARLIYIFLNKKWHFDQLVNEIIVLNAMNFGYGSTFQAIDKGLIEKIGPSGFSISLFTGSSNLITRFSFGFMLDGVFYIICFAFAFVSLFFINSLGLMSFFNTQFFLLLFAVILLLTTNPKTYSTL